MTRIIRSQGPASLPGQKKGNARAEAGATNTAPKLGVALNESSGTVSGARPTEPRNKDYGRLAR